MYLDGYSSYFLNDTYYQAASQMEKAGKLNVILGLSYEIDSWMDVDTLLARAKDVRKYTSPQIKTLLD